MFKGLFFVLSMLFKVSVFLGKILGYVFIILSYYIFWFFVFAFFCYLINIDLYIIVEGKLKYNIKDNSSV